MDQESVPTEAQTDDVFKTEEAGDGPPYLDLSEYLRPDFPRLVEEILKSVKAFSYLPRQSEYSGPGEVISKSNTLRECIAAVRPFDTALSVIDLLMFGASVTVHEGSPVAVSYFCQACKEEIDPDCCWCGDDYASHALGSHGFVPMGCNCFRAKPKEKGDDGL